jgi:hypothetical protein
MKDRLIAFVKSLPGHASEVIERPKLFVAGMIIGFLVGVSL